jgi:hypothetical protein
VKKSANLTKSTEVMKLCKIKYDQLSQSERLELEAQCARYNEEAKKKFEAEYPADIGRKSVTVNR